MTGDSFPYNELYYFRGVGHGNKNPMDKWGGYTDPETGNPRDFDDAEHVYTHDEVEMFPHDCWLTSSIKDRATMRRMLLVFDVDIYKAPDSFDPDRVSIPSNTAVARSQSGGLHVYMVVTQRVTRGNENDFEIVQDLPGDFDIDIRGEFVKQHVVAPNDIPGVGGPYELVNDTGLIHRSDPDELAQMIRMDGEPLIRYKPSGGVTRSAGGFERDEIDPPESMPKCYGAALELRKQAPERDDLNTHKVNVYAGLCGLAAGYDIDTVVSHFVDEYYPGDPDDADEQKTRYQVNHLAEKLDNGYYNAPANLSLQGHGVLPEGEWCDCDIRGHNGKPTAVSGILGNEVFAEMDETDEMDTVFGAISSIQPGDIDVDVPAGVETHDEYGCWVLVDRSTIMDAAQVVGYEIDCVDEVGDYPSGDDGEFWQVVAELRDRGANIPRYTGHDGNHPDAAGDFDNGESDSAKRKRVLKQSRTK